MSRICIVGAGFTGLSAGLELARRGHHVTVLEKDEQPGGLAGSFRVGGQPLEKFYHHWFTSDVHIMDLVRSLGLQDQVIVRESSTGMYYAHRLFKLSSPADVLRFTPLPFVSRLRLGLGVLRARRVREWRALEAVSARDWLIQVFGSRVYEVVWEPLLVGKFANHASVISAVWFWNKLKLRGGSRGQSGAENLAYYRGGFAALAEATATEIRKLGGTIRTCTAVRQMTTEGNVVTGVETDAGIVEADAVLLTVPLPIAANLLEPYTEASYTEALRRIAFLSNICLVLELDRSLSSLYWTNVNDPSFPFVGVIEHTNFEPASSYGGRHVVYLSKYLPKESPLYQMSDEAFYRYSIEALARMFPDFKPEHVLNHHLWRADYSQPIIEKNYSRLIPEVQTPLANVYLATMAQVYPEDRGTNYAVRAGVNAALLMHAAAG